MCFDVLYVIYKKFTLLSRCPSKLRSTPTKLYGFGLHGETASLGPTTWNQRMLFTTFKPLMFLWLAWLPSKSPCCHRWERIFIFSPWHYLYNYQIAVVLYFFPFKSDPPFQALVLSARYQAIKDANLSGRKLTAIRDLLMRKYQQVGLLWL